MLRRTSTSAMGCSVSTSAREGCGSRLAVSRAALSDSSARRCRARGWLGTLGCDMPGPGMHASQAGGEQQAEAMRIIVGR